MAANEAKQPAAAAAAGPAAQPRCSLHRARDWPPEKLARYNAELSRAVARLAARFPLDMTPELLARALLSGAAELWLILDEKQQFAAFLTTEMEIAVNGAKRLLILELAGRGGPDLTALLPQLEAIARAEGAAHICAYGRLGWRRALAAQGYKIATVKYTKEL